LTAAFVWNQKTGASETTGLLTLVYEVVVCEKKLKPGRFITRLYRALITCIRFLAGHGIKNPHTP